MGLPVSGRVLCGSFYFLTLCDAKYQESVPRERTLFSFSFFELLEIWTFVLELRERCPTVFCLSPPTLIASKEKQNLYFLWFIISWEGSWHFRSSLTFLTDACLFCACNAGASCILSVSQDACKQNPFVDGQEMGEKGRSVCIKRQSSLICTFGNNGQTETQPCFGICTSLKFCNAALQSSHGSRNAQAKIYIKMHIDIY